MLLTNLAVASQQRFLRTRTIESISGALDAIRAALDLPDPAGTERAAGFAVLSVVLGTWFEHSADLGQLTEAIEAARQAAAGTSDPTTRAERLSNLVR